MSGKIFSEMSFFGLLTDLHTQYEVNKKHLKYVITVYSLVIINFMSTTIMAQEQ